MIRIDQSVRKLEALLAGAVTTTQPVCTVVYKDKRNPLETAKETTIQTATLNGASAVTVCDSPPRGVYREVEAIFLRNADSASATATVRLNDNGTSYQIAKYVLKAGDQLQYTDAFGWRVMDNLGRIR